TDCRGRGHHQSAGELRSAGRALIDVSLRLHGAIIVRALLLTASREDRREDERTVRLLRGEFSAVAAELTFHSAQARARCVRVGRSLAESVLDLQTQLGTGVGSGDVDRGAGSVPACVRDRFLRSEEHTSELQSRFDLVCRLLLEKKNIQHVYTL